MRLVSYLDVRARPLEGPKAMSLLGCGVGSRKLINLQVQEEDEALPAAPLATRPADGQRSLPCSRWRLLVPGPGFALLRFGGFLDSKSM